MDNRSVRDKAIGWRNVGLSPPATPGTNYTTIIGIQGTTLSASARAGVGDLHEVNTTASGRSSAKTATLAACRVTCRAAWQPACNRACDHEYRALVRVEREASEACAQGRN